jgi:hypothetical protein
MRKVKLSPSEKLVGSGFIQSMKSIDSVLKSNYGGYKYKRR